MHLEQADILVVDDHEANIHLLSAILKAYGHVVRGAIDGFAALRAIETQLPDLILLDIMMPNMDGYALCEQLKNDPATREIPVIFISALNTTDKIVRGFEVGAVDYLTQPIHQQEVIARVHNQLKILYLKRQLEAKHQEQLNYYEYLNNMREKFIYSATHDLKNPLQLILGFAGMLGEFSPEEFRETGPRMIRGIMDGSKKMQNLIADMLDLAKMGTHTNLVVNPVEVDPFLEKCVTPYGVRADQKDLDLILILNAGDAQVAGDESRLMRVIDNLISNALKYTPNGGEVKVVSYVDDNQVVIEVSDNGMGIPDDAIAFLFEAFYRVKSKAHQEIEGTGLGLSVVKAIMEQHEGKIEVESALGVGSLFRLRLPLLSHS